MPRSIWSGFLGFGLVNVPVKLYPATQPKDVRFHQLHDADGGRIHQRRVCSVDGQEVPFEHVVKGYQVAPDRYVVITPEELEALDPKATRTIDIQEFVDLGEIDPVYFESSYYLAPDRGGARAYALLLDAMRRAGKVAIARMVLRTKQYLTLVRPVEGALLLSTMLYPDEVVRARDIPDLPAQGGAASEREHAMAEQLIGALAGKFEPQRFRDQYRDEVLALIERKVQGEAIVAPPAGAEPAPVVDLLAALEASLATGKRPGAEATGRPAAGERPGEATPARRRAARVTRHRRAG